MPKYRVVMEVTDIWKIRVEAGSEEEARTKAELLYENDQVTDNSEISDSTHEILTISADS